MERWEMQKNYDYYYRKKKCYEEKKSTITALRSSIAKYMDECILYSSWINGHSKQANYFDMLADHNQGLYSESEKQRMLIELDLLSSYLILQLQNIQGDINYWGRKLKQYDMEQEEEENS